MDLRDLKEEIRRASRHPNRTGPQRRDGYKRVLELAQSSDPSHKKIATDSIKEYFTDFPEYQEQAINAVYDLCEDQDRDTRISGYSTIASLSRADKKWLVRNADVLVQLLQIDDEREVVFVKQVLQQHVDLDPARTLQVLCDQCLFDSDGLDEDEIALRNRLRGLVLQFMKERYRTCISRVVKDRHVAEILFKGFTQAIPQSSPSEASVMVRDIIAHLPSFAIPSYRHGPNEHGDILLDALSDRAHSCLKLELDAAVVHASSQADGDNKPKFIRCNLTITQGFFALLSYITTPLSYMAPYNGTQQVIEQLLSRHQLLKHPSTAAGDSFRLLRYYLSLLSPDGLLKPKVIRSRLKPSAAIAIAWYVARAWEGCEDSINGIRDTRGRTKADFQKVRDDLVDASPSLLTVVANGPLAHVDGGRKARRAAHALIRACVDREKTTKEAWAAPDGFESALQAVLAAVSCPISSEMLQEADDSMDVNEDPEPSATEDSARSSLQDIKTLLESLLDAKGPEEESNSTLGKDITMDDTTSPSLSERLYDSVAKRNEGTRTQQNPVPEISNTISIKGASQAASVSLSSVVSQYKGNSRSDAMDMDGKTSNKLSSSFVSFPPRQESLSSRITKVEEGRLSSRSNKRLKSSDEEISMPMPTTPMTQMDKTPSLLQRMQPISNGASVDRRTSLQVEQGDKGVLKGSSYVGSLMRRISSGNGPETASVTSNFKLTTAVPGDELRRSSAFTKAPELSIKGQASGASNERRDTSPARDSDEFKIRGAALLTDNAKSPVMKTSLLQRMENMQASATGSSGLGQDSLGRGSKRKR